MKNQFQPTSSSAQTSQSLNTQSLKGALKALLHFMIHRPQRSAQSPTVASKDRYRSKAAWYVYLSDSEEQRDWLEQSYHA
ncbi:MAG: hypothetical protein AAFU53_02895 [Cyanobacteria bacterium J06632_3]